MPDHERHLECKALASIASIFLKCPSGFRKYTEREKRSFLGNFREDQSKIPPASISQGTLIFKTVQLAK